MLNLSAVLGHSARTVPERTAVVCGGTRVSYRRLDEQSRHIAGMLASCGIGRGDNVALMCPNVPDFAAVYFGILRAGAAVVPLNVLLRPEEVAYHLADSHAAALFCHEDTGGLQIGAVGRGGFDKTPGCTRFFVLTDDPDAAESPYGETLATALDGVEPLDDPVAVAPHDTAMILYTSGTTGRPKGAQLSHLNMVLNALVANDLFERTDDDAFLVSLPLFHSFGQSVLMNMGLLRGARLVLQPRFAADDALELMHAERVTLFAGVPTMYWALLEAATHDSSLPNPNDLRTAVSGGAAMSVDLMARFEKHFGVGILEGYGLSETSPLAVFNTPDRPARPGSIGTPVWGVEVRLVDEHWGVVEDEGPGETAVRGHNVMTGYFGRPTATSEVVRDGWFRTGDIARRDADGFYYIVDRAKDMIIRGGFNVYPREVEDVLMSHRAVGLAAVVGVPSDTHGEEVKAFVIRECGVPVTEAELIAWCRAHMAAYKYPRMVEFRDELPMTATGKVLKRALS
ncbi:long-chain fatty acid--CoA ligase [Streptomycetaceae bacterium NBC_01309]